MSSISIGVHCRLQRVRVCHRKLAGVVFDTKERGYMNEHVVDRGGGKGGTFAVHGSDRRERMDEAAPEPWRNAALAVITYLADNPLAECHCPDCLRLFVEEARTDVPAGLG